MVRVLFDTNILIDFLGGVPQAKCEWTRHSDRAISLITWIEVMTGVPGNKRELSFVKSFLKSFLLIPVDTGIATESVRIRQQKKLKLPDAVILATATVSSRLLLTRNTKDFPPGPNIHVPYTR